jgi:hypothetical protein
MLYRRVLAVVLVLVVGLAVAIALRSRKDRSKPRATGVEHGYQFGLIAVDTSRRTIVFPGQVVRDTGRVLTLIALTGYRWLEDSAAIVSRARLLDLQQAIAAIEWALWDSLWTGRHPGRPAVLTVENRDGRQIVGRGAEFDLENLIFLGTPEFDPIVLSSGEDADCRTCPVFDREREFIIESLRRRSGLIGYRLNDRQLPGAGTEVQVSIRIGSR